MFLSLLKPIFGKNDMKRLLASLRNWLKLQYANYKLLRAIKRQLEVRIVIGAGGTVYEGFVSTDYPQLDICSEVSFNKYLSQQTVRNFVAEHVWEHLSLEDGAKAVSNCFVFLKQGGILRIAVPDGFHPDADYIAYVSPGGYGPGSDDHKVLYNYRTLSALLENAGYKVKLLEWFDEQGKFHHVDWDTKEGFVERSTRFDQRNRANPTAYTSLIIDAIKP
jgi:predicted SAM-dependent methyltransferase